jgi:tight adherence protein C
MVPLLFAVAGVACYTFVVLGYRMISRSLPGELDLAAIHGDGGTEHRPPLLARFLDGCGRYFERFVVRRYGRRRLERLERLLVRAGRPEGFNARSFLRRKSGFGVLGILLGLMFWSTGQTLVAVLVLLLCWFWMDVWIRLVGGRRQDRIDRELPDFLDVLSVTVSAGLGFRRALDRVSASSTGPLSEEMVVTLREMDVGVPRRHAFTNLRDRNTSPALGSFVTAVLQGEELGVPLSRSLGEIAAEIRREFAQETRRRAAKAGPKVSLVVTTTIVPGAMLLIASSLILANLDSFSGVFG